jgi:hypothetical protein
MTPDLVDDQMIGMGCVLLRCPRSQLRVRGRQDVVGEVPPS